MLIDRRRILLADQNKLPGAYQEVEYIESTGTQYIDTGYAYNGISDIITLELAPLDLGDDAAFFGVYITTAQICELGQWKGMFRGNVSGIVEYPLVVGQSVTAINSNGRWSINGALTGYVVPAPVSETALLFGRRYQNKPTKLNTCRIYSVNITRDGVPIFNFVPCYRKLDNEIGMYDTVNGVFYTNKGTGKFLKGGNV